VNADELARKRDAIDSVASDLVRTSGGRLTHEQARDRVATAREQGDRKRENRNR
jgi:hypothetical protein